MEYEGQTENVHCDPRQSAEQPKVKQIALVWHRQHLGLEGRGSCNAVYRRKHGNQGARDAHGPDDVDLDRGKRKPVVRGELVPHVVVMRSTHILGIVGVWGMRAAIAR